MNADMFQLILLSVLHDIFHVAFKKKNVINVSEHL